MGETGWGSSTVAFLQMMTGPEPIDVLGPLAFIVLARVFEHTLAVAV